MGKEWGSAGFGRSIIALGRGLAKMRSLAFAEAKEEFGQAERGGDFTEIARKWREVADYWLVGRREIEALHSPAERGRRWYELWQTFTRWELPWKEQVFLEMRQKVFQVIVHLWQQEPWTLPYPLGYFQLEIGDIEGAIGSLEKELVKRPADPQTLMLLANAHYLKGDLVRAIEFYREALLERPWSGFELEIKNQALRLVWQDFEEEGWEEEWFPVYATLRGVLPLAPISEEEAADLSEQMAAGETGERVSRPRLFINCLKLACWARDKGLDREVELRRKMRELNPRLFELYLERRSKL